MGSGEQICVLKVLMKRVVFKRLSFETIRTFLKARYYKRFFSQVQVQVYVLYITIYLLVSDNRKVCIIKYPFPRGEKPHFLVSC